MSDHTAIAILIGILAVFAAAIGYIRGEQRRRDTAYMRQLEEHEQRLRTQDALIHAIAEDYDTQEPTPEQRRADFRVFDGGAAPIEDR